ncbi:MAG: hypothetical protein J6Z38_00325, partial [Lachnospiraceae bacterium]|nr:hypothetical protein [Lachnospiraceae bacterium]
MEYVKMPPRFTSKTSQKKRLPEGRRLFVLIFKKSLFHRDAGDVRLRAFVPVQEALDVDLVAD